MPYSSQDLIKQFDELIIATQGQDTEFTRIASYQNACEQSVVFVQNPEQYQALGKTTPAVLICNPELIKELKPKHKGLLISVQDVRLAQAKIKAHYDDYQAADLEWQAIHQSAVIHPSAILGNNCRVGPNVVIGADCKIADNVIIRANAVIEHNVSIGKDSIINSLANIGYDTRIGERVIIQSGAIIGNEGFGFAVDNEHQYQRIPHTGYVKIDNDVSVGSNCCIDRGTYGATIIGKGVKIDNLCHVAHNVVVGDNTLIVGGSAIAGSSTIGKRVVLSGQTGVLDHKNVCDDAILVHRCGVTHDITEPGVWAGTPPKPLKEYVRNISLRKKVTRLEQQLKQLKK